VQTLVQSAANGGFEPEVIDAAACTFLHEWREAEVRRGCKISADRMGKLSFIDKAKLKMLQSI
jgi:hypothetical protein